MTDSDQSYAGMEIDDDLSSAMGTDTLADQELVPPGFDTTPRARLAAVRYITSFNSRVFVCTTESSIIEESRSFLRGLPHSLLGRCTYVHPVQARPVQADTPRTVLYVLLRPVRRGSWVLQPPPFPQAEASISPNIVNKVRTGSSIDT